MQHGLQAASPEHTRIKPAPLVRFSVGAVIDPIIRTPPPYPPLLSKNKLCVRAGNCAIKSGGGSSTGPVPETA